VAVVMAKQKETSRDEPARFPEFSPDETFSPLHFDMGTGAYSAFSKDREEEINRILGDCIRPLLQSAASFRGKPTGLDRFLSNANRALAVYIDQHDPRRSFDRAKAGDLLRKAIEATSSARETLESIAAWQELTAYTQRIFVHAGEIRRDRPLEADDEVQAELRPIAPGLDRSVNPLEKLLRSRDLARDEFCKFSPQTLATRLRQLEPVLTLAAEHVKFQPGDYQRKELVQNFVDELALAWMCGTGRVPTYSKPSKRSRNPSPFAALLTAVNRILPVQSRNNFRDYAQRSVKQMKKEFGNRPATRRRRRD
jgi:hypothetical protein